MSVAFNCHFANLRTVDGKLGNKIFMSTLAEIPSQSTAAAVKLEQISCMCDIDNIPTICKGIL